MTAAVPRSLALLVAGAFFLETLDGTIVATAAPSMARALHVESSAIGVTMTAYLVTVAALIPVSGWLADRLGARTTFAVAVAGFTAASALCAASTSLGELTAMRVLQGAAGALMVPVGRLVVLRDTPKDQLIRVVAYLTWPALVAPVLAPVLSGLCTTYLSWRWIFLVNVPLGAVALVAALRLVPQVRRDDRAPLDWTGFLLSGVALAALTYAGALLGERHPALLPVVVLAVVGAAALALAVRHLRRAPYPLVDLGALRLRTFRVVHAGGSLYRVAVAGVPFLLPLLFQDVFGWSALRAGALVVPVFVGNLVIKPVTTPLLKRFGFRPVICGAAAGLLVTLVLAGLLSRHTPTVLVAVLLLLSGAFRSIGLSGYNTIAFADVPAEEMVHANTLSSTIQQLAAGLAVSVAAVSLGVSEGLGASAATAYRLSFWLLALLALVALLEAAALPADAGSRVRAGR
ncbi:EmrB/QacA subfamily drug resistance transporter [Motilibacter rhizosphaerae]|uniref:EmrB/QacA subfamily drug resistance transporter n=1 Tax=Motilibacter rhizosphaerae TaxID=598652 RepID=A0A4Q7NPA9_9ACTN|nr:MFS transporter [Motilibacter rhizosphaerae]RZS86858.1 EmrB/QacA subfamily drug resistance transporter [Motilibacter rhizosphaerae]